MSNLSNTRCKEELNSLIHQTHNYVQHIRNQCSDARHLFQLKLFSEKLITMSHLLEQGSAKKLENFIVNGCEEMDIWISKHIEHQTHYKIGGMMYGN